MKERLKTKLLSASAKALKMCMKNYDPFISFENLHAINKRATPNMMLLYKHSIELHKLYNANNQSTEWIELNLNQILTSRQTTFRTHKTNKLKIGNNALANRLAILNNKISLDWLNLGINSFKVKCKELFLKNE